MPERVQALEAAAAAHPDDPRAVRDLAQAYLDAQQSGLAVAVLEAAPTDVQSDPRTRHVYARALLEQGRNDDALAAEASVVRFCTARLPAADAASIEAPACDGLLLGQALRRDAILRELVAMGVEDTRADPEQSYVAYQNATREARVAAF
jgi:predicted Zn-dependent protease